MVTEVNDVKVSFRNLLTNNWDTSNTVISSQPTIRTDPRRFDEERDPVEVTIGADEDTPAQGGETGYTGLESGSGPVQHIEGTLQLDVWVDADADIGESWNAKELAYDISEEVKRIVYNNAEATASEVSDLRSLSWFSRTWMPDTAGEPVVYRYRCLAGFRYFTFP